MLTHAAPSSPRPARELNIVFFMHHRSKGAGRTSAGRKVDFDGRFFYAVSCGFMQFFQVESQSSSN